MHALIRPPRLGLVCSQRAAANSESRRSLALCAPPPARLSIYPASVKAPPRPATSASLGDLDTTSTSTPAAGTHTPSPSASSNSVESFSASFSYESDDAGSKAVLLLQCKDSKGVIAAFAQLLFGFGCNIVSSDQFTDNSSGMFFQRIRFDYRDLIVGKGNTAVLESAIEEVARRYDMTWEVSYQDKVTNVAILVSKMDHCLYDLLIRCKSGELACKIPVIISNHPDLEPVANMFGVQFRCLSPGNKGNKAAQEAEIEAIMEEYDISLMVLARYMQIFSPEFCNKHWPHTINIHHSFLPAFEGARPYHRAHDRGVKIIGATAHYATSELDAGPIIEQSITRISHKDSVKDMVRKGRDLERLVLAQAVRWHLDNRVMVFNNKTIVFDD